MTSQGNGAPSLKRISWFKNGILLETVRSPDPSSPKDFLKPIMITDADAKDGGVYICLLEVLVRGNANFNVTDHAMVAGELPHYFVTCSSLTYRPGYGNSRNIS